MKQHRRVMALFAVLTAALAMPGAGAAAPEQAFDLDVMRRALVVAGAVSQPLPAEQQKRYEECSSTEYVDVADGTRLDVARYETAYDCVDPDGWLFAFETFDSWTPPELDYISVAIDTDINLATGCDGDDYAVVGFYDADLADMLAGVFRTPTCAEADLDLVASASLQHPSPNDVGLLFDNVAIGNPSRFEWWGELAAVGEVEPEFFPGNGTHLEEGFLDACPPQASSTDGHVTRSSASAPLLSALSAARATRVTRHAYGIVTFDSTDLVGARRAVAAVDPAAVVEPNVVRRWSVVPNDPEYPAQWELGAVRADAAWDHTRGSSSTIVAVVDSGVDATHPQLTGKLVSGYDATTGTALAGGNTDEVGHGTAVAGVVGARTNDGSDIAALGWDTRVMPVKVGDANGATTADAVEGILWAVDHGARVVNVSLGSCTPSQLEQDAVAYAESRSVLVVAAAGNSGPGAAADYPAAYPTVLAVGATGFSGAIAPYSNTGSYVDLVGPGGSGDGDPAHSIAVLRSGGGAAAEDGTSFSSPIVAAAAALVYSRTPSATPAAVRSVLTSTAADRGAAGRDDTFGAGLLDAGRAVASVGSAPVAPTLTAPTTATAGVLITVSGRAAPGASVELWGVTAPNGTITRVNTPAVVADSAGNWSKTIRPLRNVNLQARVGSAVSSTRFIAVSTAVRQSVAPLAGCVVQVSGSVFEPKPGATVYMRALDSAGRPLSLGTGSVQPDGRFLLRRAYACGQTLSVYTVISGDNVNRPGATTTQLVTTRR